MEKSFTNSVALVTGGSFGIGRATALAFARKGAKVVIADCVEDHETLHQIKKVGGVGFFIQCDVSDEASVRELIATIKDRFGRLDFAFNNAGVEGATALVHESTEENWTHVLDTNLKGTWLCMKHELPMMLKQGKGVIVNNASVAGLVGFPGSSAYVASKHGVIGLTKGAALEYARQGVRVNAVCPGVIKTPMVERAFGGDKAIEEQYAEQEPIGRFGEPEEISAAVIWLCSDESSFVTGHAMAIDGGWVAQ